MNDVLKDAEVLKHLPKKSQLRLLPRYTTRPMRKGDVEGNPYHFLKEPLSDFDRILSYSKFEIVGNPSYYYTLLDEHFEAKDDDIYLLDTPYKEVSDIGYTLNELNIPATFIRLNAPMPIILKRYYQRIKSLDDSNYEEVIRRVLSDFEDMDTFLKVFHFPYITVDTSEFTSKSFRQFCNSIITNLRG